MTTTAVNVYRHRHAARTPYMDRELMSEETCPYLIGHAAGLRLSHSGLITDEGVGGCSARRAG